MATRRQLFEALCNAGVAVAKDPSDGWPGRAAVTLPSGTQVQVLIHTAPITTHARGLPGEVRLQPPGQYRPVQDDGVSIPLLLGATSNLDVVVAAPAGRHIGRNERWTVTFREDLVDTARHLGWAAVERPIQPFGHEEIWAFRTPLLPVYIDMVSSGVVVDESLLQAAILGAGLPAEPEDPDAQERARAATSRLVRDASFGGAVKAVYGDRCAMCGLGLGLVAGAHVYPATAPGSQDKVWNGVCLCENHHRAFDKHLIHVDPTTLHITMHQNFATAATAGDSAAQAFINMTNAKLAEPANPSHRIQAQMLAKRYAYFPGSYDWV